PLVADNCAAGWEVVNLPGFGGVEADQLDTKLVGVGRPDIHMHGVIGTGINLFVGAAIKFRAGKLHPDVFQDGAGSIGDRVGGKAGIAPVGIPILDFHGAVDTTAVVHGEHVI